jgi:hypothetical protein
VFNVSPRQFVPDVRWGVFWWEGFAWGVGQGSTIKMGNVLTVWPTAKSARQGRVVLVVWKGFI